MKYLKLFENFEMANEDTSGGGGYTGGVAYATMATTAGMGPVVASQPSAVPGDAAGASVGSGDIGSGWSKAKTMNSLRNDFQTKNRKRTDADLFGSSKRRVGKLTRGMKKKSSDGLFGMNTPKKKGSGIIKSFSTFTTAHNKRTP